MKIVLWMLVFSVAGSVFAEDPPRVSKRLDKTSPVLAEMKSSDTATADAQATRAQDYNSSRSNITTAKEKVDDQSCNRRNSPSANRAQDYNSSRSNNESSGVRATDYNSSRSNNVNGIASPAGGGATGGGQDNDCDGAARAAPANHNTTRSNKTVD